MSNEENNTTEQKEVVAPVNGVEKLEDTIVIGGKTIVVQKLRAANYYKAQKVFLEIVGSFEKARNTGMDDKNNIVDFTSVTEAMSSFPEGMIKIVSICSGKTEEEIGNEAYPDELGNAFTVVVKLNRFVENLKNSVAPLENLGA